MKTRPFGTKAVKNPQAAAGGADPEKIEDARTNAPLTVLTLDRIVSLQDFEDFARAFKGLGKAQAVNLWNGETYLVHITIADDSGQTVATSSDTYKNLQNAINAARDPTAEVRIDSIARLSFDVKATILYDDDYLPDDVKADIEEVLKEAFSFDKRDFAQPVTPAEIVAVIHQIKGVVSVDLDNPTSILTAAIARWQNNNILPAQLLTINPSTIDLSLTPAP
jgi:predicted phage baseplate assembly protein